MRTIRVGVAGAGHWATTAHMPAVTGHPQAELVAVADPDPGRVERARRRFGIPTGYADALAMLADCPMDALVVATPHVHHYPIAAAAVDRGLNVLVEKPLVLEPAHGQALAAAARSAGVEVLVGYTWHYNDQVLTVRRWIAEGRLGRVEYVGSFFGSSPVNLYRGEPEADVYAYGAGDAYFGPQPATYSDPRLAGGGQGQTQLTHSLALLLFLTGLEPVRVTAFMERLTAPIDVVDALAIRFRDGALGSVGSTGNVVPTDHTDTLQYLVYGSEGHLQFDVMDGVLRLYTAAGHHVEPELAAADRYPLERPARNLVDVTLGVAANGSPIGYGVVTAEVLHAAYRSAAADGAPVDLESGHQQEDEP